MIPKTYTHNRVKEARIVDKAHLRIVAGLPCSVRGCGPGGHAHHRLQTKSRKQFGKSHDTEVVPLCLVHHTELHTKLGSDTKFEEVHDLDFEEISTTLAGVTSSPLARGAVSPNAAPHKET